jgi:hypothetical protein
LKTLFKPPPADGNLTLRQQSILDLVRTHARDGVSSEQAGAHWHSLRSQHPPEDRCRFCRNDGGSILSALRKRGLVKQRRPDRTWTTTSPPPKSGYDPSTAAIPF